MKVFKFKFVTVFLFLAILLQQSNLQAYCFSKQAPKSIFKNVFDKKRLDFAIKKICEKKYLILSGVAAVSVLAGVAFVVFKKLYKKTPSDKEDPKDQSDQSNLNKSVVKIDVIKPIEIIVQTNQNVPVLPTNPDNGGKDIELKDFITPVKVPSVPPLANSKPEIDNKPIVKTDVKPDLKQEEDLLSFEVKPDPVNVAVNQDLNLEDADKKIEANTPAAVADKEAIPKPVVAPEVEQVAKSASEVIKEESVVKPEKTPIEKEISFVVGGIIDKIINKENSRECEEGEDSEEDEGDEAPHTPLLPTNPDNGGKDIELKDFITPVTVPSVPPLANSKPEIDNKPIVKTDVKPEDLKLEEDLLSFEVKPDPVNVAVNQDLNLEDADKKIEANTPAAVADKEAIPKPVVAPEVEQVAKSASEVIKEESVVKPEKTPIEKEISFVVGGIIDKIINKENSRECEEGEDSEEDEGDEAPPVTLVKRKIEVAQGDVKEQNGILEGIDPVTVELVHELNEAQKVEGIMPSCDTLSFFKGKKIKKKLKKEKKLQELEENKIYDEEPFAEDGFQGPVEKKEQKVAEKNEVEDFCKEYIESGKTIEYHHNRYVSGENKLFLKYDIKNETDLAALANKFEKFAQEQRDVINKTFNMPGNEKEKEKFEELVKKIKEDSIIII